MSNEFVMVPRCTLENVLKDGSLKAEVHASFVKAQQDIRTLLSQPAEQHQGEPVGVVVSAQDNGFRVQWSAGIWPEQMPVGTKLFTHADTGEVTFQQIMHAYEYAESHPHKYLRGTTNWCAAVAWHLNKNRGVQSGE